MSEVFNISLSVGEFPDKWKLAKFIPVYTRCSAIAEWPRCRVRYSYRQK